MKDMLGNQASILPERGEEEVWIELTDLGFPRYQISSFGRIKGINGQILHPATDKNGYLYCCLYVIENKQSVRKWVKVHRLVCRAFYGEPTDDKNLTDHIDRCRVNNYYKNLRWASKSENARNTKEKAVRRNGTKAMPIMLYNRNGNPLMTFENVKEAVEFFGISEQQLRANLSGHRAPFRFGYFRFIEDIEEEKC